MMIKKFYQKGYDKRFQEALSNSEQMVQDFISAKDHPNNLSKFESFALKYSKKPINQKFVEKSLGWYVDQIMQREEFLRGIKFLDRLKKSYIESITIELIIIKFLVLLKEYQRAQKLIKKLKDRISLKEVLIEVEKLEALIHNRKGNHKKAISLIKKILKYSHITDSEERSGLHLIMGISYASMGVYDKANISYNDALVFDKNNFLAVLGKASIFIKIGEKGIASEFIDRVIHNGIDNTNVLIEAARLSYDTRNWKQLSYITDLILKSHPNRLVALEYKLISSVKSKGIKKSIKIAEEIYKIDSTSLLALDAFIQYYDPNRQKQLDYVKKAIKEGSRSYYHWGLHSLYYLKSRDYRRALDIIQKAKKLGIGAPRAQEILCLYKLGKYKDVISILNKKQFDMKFGETLEDVGEIEIYVKTLINLGNRKKAIKFLRDQILICYEIFENHKNDTGEKELAKDYENILKILKKMLKKYEKE